MIDKVEFSIDKELHKKLTDVGVANLCVDIACIGATHNIVTGEESNEHIKLIFKEKNKPARTKVEYVKVTESIFDLKEEFERGELYVQILGDSGEYRAIEEEATLIDEMRDDNVYRKVQTELTPRKAFIEGAKSIINKNKPYTIEVVLGKIFDNLVDGDLALVDKE